MPLPDLLTKFLIDKWYKLTAYVSAVVLMLSLFYPTQQIENKYVISISVGVFLYSVVEWSQFKPRTLIEDTGIKYGLLSWRWHEKVWSIWDVILKVIAVLFVILPLLKLIFGIEIFPFPK
jgi:hypothetical protein